MPEYFAYGSNMSFSEMENRCPGAQFICVGCLEDYRLDFTRYSPRREGGVADVVGEAGSETWGLVYQISDPDLAALDGYEGFPHAYTRFQATIATDRGAMQGLWVYTVREKQEFIAPTATYLNLIKQAAADFGFPEWYLDQLSRVPVSET